MTVPEPGRPEGRRLPRTGQAGLPAGPRTARLRNDRVAFDALLRHGPLTRRAIRDHTGLSAPTVADLTDRLRRLGIVTVSGADTGVRRGPNPALYAVNARHAYVVAVAVRPDRLRARRVDLSGVPAGTAAIDLDPSWAPSRAVLEIASRVTGARPRPADRLSIAVPGVIDPELGDIAYVESLPGWRANLRDGLLPQWGVSVGIENEVNLAGVAEYRRGAARGEGSFALLWLDDGLGVAVLMDGVLHRGASGGAGEVGYLRCGESTFHELAGAAAIGRLARSCGLPAARATPVADSGTAAALVAAAVASPGTAASRRFLDELAARLAAGVADVCAVLDPGLVVLGGPVGAAGSADLAGRVEAAVADRVPLRTRVAATAGGADPVLTGAAMVGLQRVYEALFAE